MSSEDSDDEPLASFAATKSRNLVESGQLKVSRTVPTDYKINWDGNSSNVSMWPDVEEQALVERPSDVWLYLKDFNATGPYSCLLCSEWFINKSKIVIHYIINHQKDYCGICRYFVPHREAWWEHQKFHIPWKCSQCADMFTTLTDLRKHFSNQHQLIHCRLCYLRVSDDDQYNIHLYQKHSVTNISSKHNDVFWDFEYEGSPKYICLLCMKPNTNSRPFVDHFLSYHHFTLKCLSFLISGTDLPLYSKGLDLTPEFIETQLKDIEHYGYVDLKKPIIKEEVQINEHILPFDCNPITDPEATDVVEDSNINDIEEYNGDEDYDITLLELIPIQRCYFDYINELLTQVTSDVMPQCSKVNYGTTLLPMSCCYCPEICKNDNALIYHMSKMHFVRTLPKYSCRVCTNLFHTGNELKNHISEEMGEFEDLWICQFCDKEFNNREETREHLTEHWNVIEYDNCFSPHLGFKCSFCPTLFWNETDREKHHLRVHFEKNKNSFYKCTICDEKFGDRVWFTHHFIENHNPALYLLKCCICCDVLNPNDARNHLIQHHPEAKKIFCSLPPCKYKPFTQKKSFNMHLKTKHNPSNRLPRLICTQCGQQFTSSQARFAHMTHIHGLSRCYKCTLCKETLKTVDERKMHYLLHHPGRYQYQCPMCEKSFRYKSSLYIHKQEHASNKPNYTCNFCGKAFVKKDSYREHMQIHETPRHACSYCPMRFVQRSNMLRHERRHTGERPYSCRLCPRTFADKGACTSHYRTHQKEAAFACMYCDQTFVQKSKLTYHIRKHTGENLETCDICYKKFTSAGSLREHMKVHIRNKMKKTVQCPLCKRMYPDEQSKLRHMRSSHRRGSHDCPLCHTTLISASSLREHIVRHAKVKMFRCRLCIKSYHTKRPMLRHIQLRHKVDPKLINMTVHYRRLGLQECKLGLDEDTLKKIFSPSKRKNIIETSEAPISSQNVDQSEKIEIKIEMIEPLQPDFVNVKSEIVSDDDEINDL